MSDMNDPETGSTFETAWHGGHHLAKSIRRHNSVGDHPVKDKIW